MPHLFILTLSLLLTFNSFAQFDEIDNYARKVPKSAQKSIGSLSNYLTQPYQTRLEKYRAIYAYMQANIPYDYAFYLANERYKPNVLPKSINTFKFKLRNAMFKTRRFFLKTPLWKYQRPETVLKRKTGVCSGLSALYKALCDSANLPAWEIDGYTKGYFYQPGEPFYSTNHAWNAIETEQGYAIIDVTWDKWIDKSDSLRLDHIPMDPMWQLLDYPYPIDSFELDSTQRILNWVEINRSNTDKSHLSGLYFNFQDSLKAYRQLNKNEQNFVSISRSIEYNPKNHTDIGFAWYGLGLAYADKDAIRKIDDSEEFRLMAQNRSVFCFEQADFHLTESKKTEIPQMYLVHKSRYKREYDTLAAKVKAYKAALKSDLKSKKESVKIEVSSYKQQIKNSNMNSAQKTQKQQSLNQAAERRNDKSRAFMEKEFKRVDAYLKKAKVRMQKLQENEAKRRDFRKEEIEKLLKECKKIQKSLKTK